MTYAVTAPLVIVKDDEGTMHHVYFGGRIPANADEEHVKQLLEGEMIEEVQDAPDEAQDATPDEPQRPDGRAGREKWAEYAKLRGASEDEVKPESEGGLSKADLVEKYGN